jgi:exodeoxyribonuclease VIII
MESGWFPGISDQEYHSADGRISSSGCKEILKSPAHYRANYGPAAIPGGDTPAFLIGKAAHCLILEGIEAYRKRFVVAPVVDKRTKAGKAAWQEFIDSNPGKVILAQDQEDLVTGMAESVSDHPVIPGWIAQGVAEISGYYEDPATATACKIRPDCLIESRNIIIDLKTTFDASPEAFSRDIARYKYHLSAAMYSAGFELLTGRKLTDFIFVVVEKSAPYSVAVYRLDPASLAAGSFLYRQALNAYSRCLERNSWPGYPAETQTLSIPAYAMPDLQPPAQLSRASPD